MALIHPDNVLFIDFEASSLNGALAKGCVDEQLSYPIEVGVSDSSGKKYSKLIFPEPHWIDWNERVERDIHKISRADLALKGEGVKDVALWLNKMAAGKVVYCDSKAADSFWNKRLFDAAGVKCAFNILCLYNYISSAATNPLLEKACEQVDLSDITEHRAGDDALALMRIYSKYYALKNMQKPSGSPKLAP